MKRITTIILLAMLTFLGVQAKHLSGSEALQLAFQKTAVKAMKANIQRYQLAYSAENFYAYNDKNGGFVILAADDCLSDIVLGYSDSGEFNYASIPDGMKELLQQLNDEVAEEAAICAAHPNRVSSSLDVLDPIEPLVKCQWNQSYPYNLMAPTNSSGEHYAAGCVPVAMGQLMKYHEWPMQGTGHNSYSWDADGTTCSLDMDFSQSFYDWDNMCDTYGRNNTDEQNNAVAKLLLDCGVSVGAKYKSGATTANSENVGPALFTYFNYDKGLKHVKRMYYTKREWRDLLYGNLAEGLPMFYRGQSTDGGHAFVCDGYKDGLFHINWGWSGMSDGYFQIELLEPAEQGIGGSTSGYQRDQAAIIDIRPDAGSTVSQLMYCTGNVNIKPLTATTSSEVTVSGYFENDAFVTASYTLGIQIKDSLGNIQYVESTNLKDKSLANGGILQKMTINLADAELSQGSYTITPAYFDVNSNQWLEMKVNKTVTKQFIMAQVDAEGNITFSYPSTAATIHTNSLEARTRIIAGYDTDIDLVVACTEGEYLGNVTLAFLESGTNNVVSKSSSFFITVAEGEEIAYNASVTNPVTAGTYDLVLLDANNNIVSDRIETVVEEAPAGELSLKGTLKATNTDIDDLQFNLNLQCTSGVFNSKIYIYIYESPSSAEPVGSISPLSRTFLVEGDDPIDIKFSGSFPNFTVGKYYYAYAYYADPSWIMIAQRRFKTTEPSGIEDIQSSDTRNTSTIYNLSGQKVSKLSKGIFVKNGKKILKLQTN